MRRSLLLDEDHPLSKKAKKCAATFSKMTLLKMTLKFVKLYEKYSTE
jgi:hypothetical protein